MLGIDAAPEPTKEPDARRLGCPVRRLGAVVVLCDTTLSFVIKEAR